MHNDMIVFDARIDQRDYTEHQHRRGVDPGIALHVPRRDQQQPHQIDQRTRPRHQRHTFAVGLVQLGRNLAVLVLFQPAVQQNFMDLVHRFWYARHSLPRFCRVYFYNVTFCRLYCF